MLNPSTASFPRRSAACRSARRPLRTAALSAAALLLAAAAAPISADQILVVSSDTLTTYRPSGATAIGDIRPLHLQRGVGLDGQLRAPSGQGWAMAGNPFGDAVPSTTRLGEVNLLTGAYSPTEIDLALPAPGNSAVVIGRTFNGRQETSAPAHRDSNGVMGYNWHQLAMPELVFFTGATADKDVVYIVYGADRYIELQRTGENHSTFRAVNGAAGIVRFASGSSTEEQTFPSTYTYYDQAGNTTVFIGGDGGAAAWQFWKRTDPAGNSVYVGSSSLGALPLAGYTSGKIEQLFDGADRRYCFSYSTVGGVSRLSQVLCETDAGGGWGGCGTETEVARVTYDYYTADGDDHGMAGDLKLVTVTTPLTDSGITDKRRTYYRYYDQAYDNSDGRRGEPHQVKMVLKEGCRSYDYAADSTLEYGGGSDPEFLTASDASLKPYSQAYFEYGSSDYKIASAFFAGECGCSGGADGTYSFTYRTNGGFSPTSGYDTAWLYGTTYLRPDGIYESCAFDETGQPLWHVVTDGNPAVSYTDMWATEVVRNSAGQVTAVHTPANNDNSYTHSTGSFSRKASAGLVHVYTRRSGGDLDGFPEGVQYKEGSSGTAYFTSWTDYTDRDLNIAGSVHVTRPMVATRRAYHEGTANDFDDVGTFYDTTMSYAWWETVTDTSVLYITPKQVTTTHPIVTTANNGSNSATARKSYLRQDGTAAFSEAEDGIFTYMQYTGGQLTKRVDDVITNGSFPSGDDPNTDWGITESGSGSNRTTQYAYDAQGRMDTTTPPDASTVWKTKAYYSRLKDGRLVTLSFPRMTTSSVTYFGPVSYRVANHAGKTEMSGTVALAAAGLTDASHPLTDWIKEGDADPVTALDKGTLVSMSTSLYTASGHQLTEARGYFSLPGSGAGSEGTNYDAVRYGYDDMGRKWRVKDATGTITRTAFDDLGRPWRTYIGTNDTSFAGGEPSGSDNMVKVRESTFDGGSDGGNSHVTTQTAFIQDSTTGQRQTVVTYDFRGRPLLTVGDQAPYSFSKFDNLGRIVATAMYTSTASLDPALDDPTTEATNRCALSRTLYDERGRVYETRRYQINQSTGAIEQVSSLDQYLAVQTWFDSAGRVVKVDGAQLSKTLYDRLGRATHRFTLASDNDGAYADVDDVSGDIVLEEHQTIYEGTDSDNVVMTAAIRRHHNDLSSGTTGALDSNADGNSLKYTMANISGRIQIQAMWYDDLDRLTDTVVYGTNGSSDFDRKPGTPAAWLTVPSRSAAALRTTTTYTYDDGGTTKDDGRVHEVTDPRGKVTRTLYDALSRTTAIIRNYVNGTPSSETGDDDVYTRYVYSKGLKIKEWVDFDGDNVEDAGPPKDQVTLYVYGTTKGTPSQSKLATGHLLRAVRYPDSTNTGDELSEIDGDSSDVVSFAYNAQGQVTYKKDQNGTVLETDYDTAGRTIHERATTLGSGVDNWVRRKSTVYLSRGLIDTITQYSSATVGSGTDRDQVKYTYDGWGNITGFEQDPDSIIGASGRASFTTSYSYEKATGGRNTLRCTGMTYPGGSALTYEYLSAGNSLDDAASRVSTVKVGSTVVVSYRYNGVAQLVGTTLDEPAVYSRQYDTGSPQSYTGLDGFGRVVNSTWVKDLATDRAFYDVAVAYDEASSITSIVDAVRTDSGTTRLYDAKYSIDGLSRLTQAEEGYFATGNISGRTRQEDWILSQVGNWKNHKRDLNGDNDRADANEFQEDRTFNAVNELLKRELNTDNNNGTTGGTAPYDVVYDPLTYDGSGNLTDDAQDYEYVYTAWNQVRKVNRTDDQNPIAEFYYNGLGYLIQVWEDSDTDGVLTVGDFRYYRLYDPSWRHLGSYRASDANPKERLVYHNAGLGGRGSSSYIDSVVLKDSDTTSWTSAGSGSLGVRRYYCQNWRHDVSAMVTDAGKLVEWVKYSAYGEPTRLAAGDADGDTRYTSADDTLMTNGGAYRVLEDPDLDGDNDASDVTHATSITGGYQSTPGYGLLSYSYTINRKGYAGYEHATSLAGAKAHIRHRFYDTALGWYQIDPMRYVDGMSLHQYASGRPLELVDPMGEDCVAPCLVCAASLIGAGLCPGTLVGACGACILDPTRLTCIACFGAIQLCLASIGTGIDSCLACSECLFPMPSGVPPIPPMPAPQVPSDPPYVPPYVPDPNSPGPPAPWDPNAPCGCCRGLDLNNRPLVGGLGADPCGCADQLARNHRHCVDNCKQPSNDYDMCEFRAWNQYRACWLTCPFSPTVPNGQ